MSRATHIRWSALVALAAAVAVALPGCAASRQGTGGTSAANTPSVTPALATAAPAGAAAVAMPDTVTAAGTGKALSSPDIAEMTFGVSARNGDAEKAMDSAAKTGKRIAAALKKEGISAKDIQTTNVSLYPQTGPRGEVTEFSAMISVRATVRDIAALGKVITAATKAGSNEVMGPAFLMEDANPARGKAIENAIADAKARAEVMAKAAGRKLGRVVAVVESGASPVQPYWGQRAAADMAASVPVEPGQVETAASVSVTFELL